MNLILIQYLLVTLKMCENKSKIKSTSFTQYLLKYSTPKMLIC